MKTNHRRLFRTIVLAGTVLMMYSAASAKTYYVSLKGDDAEDGATEVTAFRTISKGVSVLQAGDTLIIKSGDYGNEMAVLKNSGRKDAPILIKAETPGKVILTGEKKGVGLTMIDKSHVVVEGLKFTRYGAGLVIKHRSSYVTVRRCIFLNNENAGIVLNDGSLRDPKICHHHLFTENQFLDYSGAGLGSPLSGGGISDYGLRMYFSSNVEVTNNYFYGHHHQCLSFKEIMVDCRAAGNVFEGAYYTGVYLGQNEDNEVGYQARSRNLVAEYNVFRPSPEYRLKSPIWVANVTGAIVRNNFMDAPNGYSGQGIGVNVSAKDVKIYSNVIVDTSASRDNPGIRIAADCEIYNNTIAGCHSALEFYFKTEGQKIRAVCRNNIFYKNTMPIHTIGKKGDYSASVFERNNWLPDWSGKGKTDISSDPDFVGPIERLKFNPYNPGAGGRGDRSGRPAPSGDIELTPFAPKFVPDFKRAWAYRLKKGSPCIDKGVEVGLPFAGKTPDIGAYEFGQKVGVLENAK
ncbi:MAG: right-handed parallel beta-helix repeat-containing protein [Planctomycetota bacterium]|nr:right-handed parallel beta-helix repeat-containing protein [Planctomycetota bacterium]